MAAPRVLVVDDEPGVRFGVRDFLEGQGFEVFEAGDCASAQRRFRDDRPDAVLLDYQLPDGDALSLLAALRDIDTGPAHIVLTGHGSIELAVRAIKAGAEQFLTKPVEMQALLMLLHRTIEAKRNRKHVLANRRAVAREANDPFVGPSAATRRLAEQARRLLDSDSPVLIQGETGTGKGVVARWLHDNGRRAQEAYVDINCAGLSRDFLEAELFGHEKGAFTGAIRAKPGLLEIADGGTLLLDEIADLAPELQPRLLKVIEDKRFRRIGEVRERSTDVRLIAATNRNLDQLVAQDRFRPDLYFRINTLPLTMPPLRERVEDLGALIETLLNRLSSDLGRAPMQINEGAARALREYSWPGNIRELRNVLDRAILVSEGSVIDPRHLHLRATLWRGDGLEHPVDATLDEVERHHIERVLQTQSGHVDRAAAILGIPRSTLYSKIKRFGLNSSES